MHALLTLLELEGCIVTIDAMGCQLKIAKQIIEQKADYVLGLKGNQGLLHKDVDKHFRSALNTEFKGLHHSFHMESEKKHGRYDVRKYWILDAPETLHRAEKWKKLKTIGMVERESTTGDKTTKDRRYFICSIEADAATFAKAVRSHWEVENNLHWCLDVTFREDDSRIRTGHAPAWNDGFRYKVLFGQ